MTAAELALLVLAFLAILTGGAYVVGLILGPDPDLDEPIRFAPCGQRDCHNPHPYAPWRDRVR